MIRSTRSKSFGASRRSPAMAQALPATMRPMPILHQEISEDGERTMPTENFHQSAWIFPRAPTSVDVVASRLPGAQTPRRSTTPRIHTAPHESPTRPAHRRSRSFPTSDREGPGTERAWMFARAASVTSSVGDDTHGHRERHLQWDLGGTDRFRSEHPINMQRAPRRSALSVALPEARGAGLHTANPLPASVS